MSDSVYKTIELIGTSEVSWEDAAKEAVTMADNTLKDLRIAEIISQDCKIDNGTIVAFRTKVRLSFKFIDE